MRHPIPKIPIPKIPIPKIWNDGSTCYIIGGGPSVAYAAGIKTPGKDSLPRVSEFLTPIHEKKIIGVNNAYMLGNWVDVLWFGDSGWFTMHRANLARVGYMGLKMSCHPRFNKNPIAGVVFTPRDMEKPLGITTKNSKVSWNYNSGGCAINLAYHLGARRIILLGFDMQSGGGKSTWQTHWHGGHKDMSHEKRQKVWEPRYQRFLQGFPIIAQDAKALGIEIINAVHPSFGSAIEHFPKIPIQEVLRDGF